MSWEAPDTFGGIAEIRIADFNVSWTIRGEIFSPMDTHAEHSTRPQESLSQGEPRRLDACAPIDAHVHIVGNGLRGSGCWLRVGAWHRPLAAFMLRHIGVGVSMASAEFDGAYASHLARLVRESSLSAAVILAQDEVYDASGR